MEMIEHTNYKIVFEIKGEPLCIQFGSYNDYTLIPKKELEEFIIYLLKKCINATAFMKDNERALFVKNVYLYKNDEKIAIYSIEGRSIQLYP